MSGPASRRGFLRGLTMLPLIGGGVTLIGAPSAVAEPVTKTLLAGYADWLLLERRILLHELFPDQDRRRMMEEGYLHRSILSFHIPPYAPPVTWQTLPQPSTRAALVLSAVGADWREGGR